jgi:hypothetical protein
MRSVYERNIAEATEIERNILRGKARICSANFGRAWKGLFPAKAAEALADHSGCSIRTAGYELSGQIPPSAQSIKALVDLVVPNRG